MSKISNPLANRAVLSLHRKSKYKISLNNFDPTINNILKKVKLVVHFMKTYHRAWLNRHYVMYTLYSLNPKCFKIRIVAVRACKKSDYQILFKFLSLKKKGWHNSSRHQINKSSDA